MPPSSLPKTLDISPEHNRRYLNPSWTLLFVMILLWQPELQRDARPQQMADWHFIKFFCQTTAEVTAGKHRRLCTNKYVAEHKSGEGGHLFEQEQGKLTDEQH